MIKRIHIDGSFYFFLAVLLLMLPIRWIMAAFLAAFIHELGHCIAVLLLGGRITEVFISFRGARLDAAPMGPGRELLCVFAGPIASLSLIGLHLFFPRIAICGIIQGLFNLLPIYPLDGGKAVRCIKCIWQRSAFCAFSRRGGKIPCKEADQRVQ